MHQKWENDNVGHLLLPCHWLMFWYYFFSRTWTTWSAIENLFFVLPLNALLGIDFYGHIMIKPFKKQLAKNLHVLQIGTMVGTFWTFMERRNAVLNFFHSEDEKVKEIWLRFVLWWVREVRGMMRWTRHFIYTFITWVKLKGAQKYLTYVNGDNYLWQYCMNNPSHVINKNTPVLYMLKLKYIFYLKQIWR